MQRDVGEPRRRRSGQQPGRAPLSEASSSSENPCSRRSGFFKPNPSFWFSGIEEEEDASSDESEAEVIRGCGQSKGFLRPGGNSGASSVHAYMRSGGECMYSGESTRVLCRALCTHCVKHVAVDLLFHFIAMWIHLSCYARGRSQS